MQSLKDRVIIGVKWSFIENILSYGFAFLVGIVLARLLTPDEYGLIGIVTIFITFFNTISESGFSSALIRKTDANENDYNTAFYTNVAFSIALYALLFFCAPAIAQFFNRQELTPLTRVLGLCLIINALTFTQSTILSKRMDFKTQTKASIISALIGSVIGIWMALEGYGVWALVFQQLFKQIVGSLCLWIAIGWTPARIFSKSSFTYLWGFGWKLSVSGMIDSLSNQISKFVIGKLYSPSSLGQFSRSEHLAGFFSSGLTSIIQQISYPALSELQDDKEKMMAAYRIIIKNTMFITAICMFALGAISEPLLYCLIGPQWHDAAVYLPLICLDMSLYPLHAINLNMLQVQGRSDLFLKLEVIKKVICLPVLFIGIFFGIIPMLATEIITSVLCYFLNSHWSGKLLGYGIWKQVMDVAPAYRIASLIALSVFFLKFLPLSYWVILPMQIFVGIIVFFVTCKITGIEEYIEVKELIIRYLKRNKH